MNQPKATWLIADDLVQTVRAITNPEKLAHLGTFARRPGPRS
ncbi:MAG: hypothetical protein ACRDHV_02110 [Actinomycetota bacterium]